MTARDFDQFTIILRAFAELKSKQLSVTAIELYWRAMSHWSIDDFKSAAEQLVRTCKFFPTPSEFEDLRKAGRMTAAEAWTLVLDAARGNAPHPTDPRILAAVRALGGFHAIGMSRVDQTHFLEKRFVEHYESINDAEDTREALPNLTGGSKLLDDLAQQKRIGGGS